MKFIFKITKRYEYRQLLALLKKLPQINKYLIAYSSRELLFDCSSEKEGTLLAAVFTNTLRSNNIEYDMRILKDSLTAGDAVDIYITKDDGTRYLEGKGELIKFLSTDGLVYPVTTKARRQVNVVKEKWLVRRTDDPFITGNFVRNFEKFHSTGIITIESRLDLEEFELMKEYCVDFLENDPILCKQLTDEYTGKRKETELLRNFIKYKDDLSDNS